MPYLPPEILLPIFSHVQNGHDPAQFPNLDLMSCSLVCHLWYEFAFPLLEPCKRYNTCLTGKFTHPELERLADLLAISQHYGLAHGALIVALDLNIHQLFVPKFLERIDRHRLDAIGRLLRVLRPHLKSILLDLQGTSTPTALKNLREIVVQLLPDLTENITSLQISHLTIDDHKSIFQTVKTLTFSFSKPPPVPNPTTHPICLLIDHLAPHLHSFRLFTSKLLPSIIYSLRACPNLRTLRISRFYSKVTAADLADAVSRWPHLRHLAILDMGRDDYTRLGPTITRLAATPPSHLSTLELDNYWSPSPPDASCDLRVLISRCAQTLVTLTLPAMDEVDDDHIDVESSGDGNGDNGDEDATPSESFLDFLAGLNMPRLRILDMSRAGAALFVRSTQQAAIPWPELRSLDAVSCNRLGPGFFRRVVLGCPSLEDLRISYSHERIMEVEEIMQEADGFMKKEEKMDGGCGQKHCESCALVRFSRS